MCISDFHMADTSRIETSKIATLQQIWQRIFHRSIIGPDDDFFDLGGNTWLAAELFTEINNDLGTNLSPATICTSSTVAALVRALDQPQSQGPAILLKSSPAQAAPIFMFHGIGSSIIDMVPLVRRMKSDRPVYGLESRGNDGRAQPQERIEDIAQSFLAAMSAIQPHGPCFLIGYSFGGLVALEIAQQLKKQSREIALLMMLDSYPDRRYLKFGQYSRLLLQLARNRMSGRASPLAASRARVSQGGNQHNSLLDALQRTKAAHYRALHGYRPLFYDGEVEFVRAATPSNFPADPIPVWSDLVRRLQVETVPGEHVTLLTTSAHLVALLIDKYILNAVS